jgi:spore coat protein U-like protein
MKSRHYLKGLVGALVVAGLIIGVADRASAASASATMAVSASVTNNCTISTNPLSFGSYDPIVANASGNLDATSSVVVACTKGAATTIGLDTGANATAGERRLGSSGSYIGYELYSDSTRSTVWGNSGAGLYAPAAAPSKASRTFSVYGRISGGQDVPAGSYSDTITATVNF